MIGRTPHPTKPSNMRAVALYMTRRPVWESLPWFHAGELAAARACARALESRYSDIALQARILRVLCEHPEFEFEFAGIDADTVRAQAQAVDELLQAQVLNVRHLVERPGPEDIVRVDGLRMTVGAGGMLEAREDDASTQADAGAVLTPEDEAQLELMLKGVVDVYRGLTGRGSRGEAYARMMRLLEELGAPDNNGPDAADAGADRDGSDTPPR
jgi:hypothetical protein